MRSHKTIVLNKICQPSQLGKCPSPKGLEKNEGKKTNESTNQKTFGTYEIESLKFLGFGSGSPSQRGMSRLDVFFPFEVARPTGYKVKWAEGGSRYALRTAYMIVNSFTNKSWKGMCWCNHPKKHQTTTT